MKNNKTLTIGYFNQLLTVEWAILPWQGAVIAAKKFGINLISFHGKSISGKSGFDKQENIIYDIPKDGSIDGLISWKGHLTSELNDQETKNFYSSFKVPVVTIEGQLKGFPCVTYGNYEGMKLIVKHLIDHHGFKKIGYLGLVGNHHGFEERQRAYTETMQEYGYYNNDLVRPWCPWDNFYNGRPVDEVLVEWLKDVRSKGIEAIIGSCDPIAMWVISIMKKIDIMAPYDITVAGYDGFTDSRITTPSLTTINPSWNELGYKAVELMLDLIKGKNIAEITIVKPHLVISQTCGCMENNLLSASRLNLKGFKIYEKKKDLIGELDLRLKGMQEIKGVDFFNAFIDDVTGRKNNSFIKYYDLLLREYIKRNENLDRWHDIIAILKITSKRRLLPPWQKNKADVLCNMAGLLTCIISSRHQEFISDQRINRINNERNLGLNLTSNFNLDVIMDILARELPALGIKEFFIALFENPSSYKYPDPCPEWSRLIMAYDENGRMPVDKNGYRFPTRQIIPYSFLRNDYPKNLMVNSLFFNQNQIGYAIFDGSDISGKIYGILASQISSALQGTMLIDSINLHSQTLESGIERLSGSINEMVANIESINTNIFRQSAAVEQSASSVEEMKGNISNISNISKKAADISNNLDLTSTESIKSIANMISSIKIIQSKSSNIIELLDLIQEISNKTKLLAFNASVEAAHAGTSGSGFKIVSQEIRKLADGTDISLKKIGLEINNLISSIDQASSLSELIETNLDKIKNNSRMNTEISGQINIAMQEQNKGSVEVLSAIVDLVKITTEIKISMAEQVKTTEVFKKAINELRKNIK